LVAAGAGSEEQVEARRAMVAAEFADLRLVAVLTRFADDADIQVTLMETLLPFASSGLPLSALFSFLLLYLSSFYSLSWIFSTYLMIIDLKTRLDSIFF